ncbi:MAG: DUF1704 domain-containing protein [Acidobacteria bacterium]|nr:DUF1704 domain-containing protein [Acidobacteriota bacterium]
MIVAERQLESVSAEELNEVTNSIRDGRTVRLGLPEWGWLYFERQLPFLFFYRPPEDQRSWESELFVLTESSCLVAPAEGSVAESLIGTIESAILPDPLLIIEIVNGVLRDVPKTEGRSVPRPSFRICAGEAPQPIARVLAESLEPIRLFDENAVIEIIDTEPPPLETMPSSIHIALEITPVHVNPATGQPFPIVLQELRRQLSRALQRTAFSFCRSNTHCQPAHFESLGRHEVIDSDWVVDRELTRIADSFGFLLDVTPVNQQQAWREFQESGFRGEPRFEYRRLTIDPEIAKGDLYRIPIDEVEDPTLCHLFREKRAELARMLTMLEERNTDRFIYNSLQLYGPVEQELAELAGEILSTVDPPTSKTPTEDRIDAGAFERLAREELDHYRDQLPGVEAGVEVLPEITSLMVTNGTLCIPSTLSIPRSRLDALLHHEVGTHIVTWLNGKSQRLEQLYTGLAGYDELQEGLAVLAEYLVGQLSDARLRLLAGRVIAVSRRTEEVAFDDAFHELVDQHRFTPRQAFGIVVRVWRGGGLTKDAIYLRGLRNLLDYLADGGDMEILYMGKITESHIPVVRELLRREILVPPPLRPRYLDFPESKTKIEALRHGRTVLDLRSNAA